MTEGDSPTTKLTNDVIKSLSAYIMRDMQEKTMRAKVEKLRRGEIVTTGVPPLGYRFKDGSLEPIPEETEIVREMFRIFVETGHIDPTVKYLDGKGLTTKRGNPYRRTTVRKVLNRTTYKGTYTYKGFEFAVPPIVDLDTWNKAHEILSGNTFQKASKALERNWELSGGVAKCGECGRNLTPVGRDIKNKRYHYYYCDNRVTCSNQRYYRAEELEMVGIRFLQDFYSENSTFRDMVIQNLEQTFKEKSRGNPEESKKNHIKRINKLDAETEKAEDLAIKGLISEEKLRATKEKNSREKKAHEAEILKLSDLEAHAEKIQRFKEWWKPMIEDEYITYLGLRADEEESIQIGENEWEYIPTDEWLQKGAPFRRERYRELGINIICTPDSTYVQVNGEKIFVGPDTTSTTRAT